MTRFERRIVLGILLGLLLFHAAALNPMGGPGVDVNELGTSTWFGSWIAQAALLATWAGLGSQPLATRLPRALSVAAGLSLIDVWISTHYGLYDPEAHLLILCTVIGCFLWTLLALSLLRWRRGWQIVLGEDDDLKPRPSAVQFTLRQLLLWTTMAAICLGLVAYLLRDPLSNGISATVFLAVPLCTAIVAVLAMPMLIPTIGFVLADRSRVRFGIWATVMTVLLNVALSTLLGMIDPWAIWENSGMFALLQIGFLGMLGGGLFIVRLCGYRLVRAKRDAILADSPFAATRTAPDELVSRKSPFVSVIIGLLLAVLILLWPAFHLHKRRQAQADFLVTGRAWQRVGAMPVTADPLGGREVDALMFAPGQSLTEAALRKLAEPQSAAKLRQVYLSGTRVTDAQLSQLAELENLEILDLSSTRITDAGLVHLYGMKKLNLLDLTGTRVSSRGVGNLQQAIPNCQIQGGPPPGSQP